MIYYNSSFFNIWIQSLSLYLFEHASSESSSTHDPKIAYIFLEVSKYLLNFTDNSVIKNYE